MSSRPFLCILSMYFYQQRCTNKISNQKYTEKYFHAEMFSHFIHSQSRRSAWHCVSWCHICNLIFEETEQQRCVYKISKPNLKSKINPSIIVCLPKYFPPNFLSWRRYTFLSHLATKSKISVRWIKKLVAVTGGVYASKYITPKPHTIYKHILALYVPQIVASGYIPTPIFVYM